MAFIFLRLLFTLLSSAQFSFHCQPSCRFLTQDPVPSAHPGGRKSWLPDYSHPFSTLRLEVSFKLWVLLQFLTPILVSPGKCSQGYWGLEGEKGAEFLYSLLKHSSNISQSQLLINMVTLTRAKYATNDIYCASKFSRK